VTILNSGRARSRFYIPRPGPSDYYKMRLRLRLRPPHSTNFFLATPTFDLPLFLHLHHHHTPQAKSQKMSEKNPGFDTTPPRSTSPPPATCKVVLAGTIASRLMGEVQAGLSQLGRKPLLVGFLANSDPAAKMYADWTAKTCSEKLVPSPPPST
jgi:hypothetical protein